MTLNALDAVIGVVYLTTQGRPLLRIDNAPDTPAESVRFRRMDGPRQGEELNVVGTYQLTPAPVEAAPVAPSRVTKLLGAPIDTIVAAVEAREEPYKSSPLSDDDIEELMSLDSRDRVMRALRAEHARRIDAATVRAPLHTEAPAIVVTAQGPIDVEEVSLVVGTVTATTTEGTTSATVAEPVVSAEPPPLGKGEWRDGVLVAALAESGALESIVTDAVAPFVGAPLTDATRDAVAGAVAEAVDAAVTRTKSAGADSYLAGLAARDEANEVAEGGVSEIGTASASGSAPSDDGATVATDPMDDLPWPDGVPGINRNRRAQVLGVWFDGQPPSWRTMSFMDLRIGDCYRLIEEDGTPVDGGRVYLAKSNAFEMAETGTVIGEIVSEADAIAALVAQASATPTITSATGAELDAATSSITPTPTEPAKPEKVRPRGWCPACRQFLTVRADGTMMQHYTPDGAKGPDGKRIDCQGVGLTPAAERPPEPRLPLPVAMKVDPPVAPVVERPALVDAPIVATPAAPGEAAAAFGHAMRDAIDATVSAPAPGSDGDRLVRALESIREHDAEDPPVAVQVRTEVGADPDRVMAALAEGVERLRSPAPAPVRYVLGGSSPYGWAIIDLEGCAPMEREDGAVARWELREDAQAALVYVREHGELPDGTQPEEPAPVPLDSASTCDHTHETPPPRRWTAALDERPVTDSVDNRPGNPLEALTRIVEEAKTRGVRIRIVIEPIE